MAYWLPHAAGFRHVLPTARTKPYISSRGSKRGENDRNCGRVERRRLPVGGPEPTPEQDELSSPASFSGARGQAGPDIGTLRDIGALKRMPPPIGGFRSDESRPFKRIGYLKIRRRWRSRRAFHPRRLPYRPMPKSATIPAGSKFGEADAVTRHKAKGGHHVPVQA